MKVVMDKAGRIYIPKAVVESMGIILPCDVNIYVNIIRFLLLVINMIITDK